MRTTFILQAGFVRFCLCPYPQVLRTKKRKTGCNKNSYLVVAVVRSGGEFQDEDGCVGVDPVGGDGEIVSGEGGAEEVGDDGEAEKGREAEEDYDFGRRRRMAAVVVVAVKPRC